MLAAAAAALTLATAADSLAASRLEGYYALSIAAQKNDRRWEFGSPDDNGIPSHYGELKFFSSPRDHFEIFTKLRAWSNRERQQHAAAPTTTIRPGTRPRAT